MTVRTRQSLWIAVLTGLCWCGTAVEGGAETTLPEATEYALSHNPRLAAALDRQRAAEAQVGRVRGTGGLQLRASLDALRYSFMPPNKEKLLGPGNNDFLAAVDASHVLFSPALRAQVDAVTADYLSAVQRLRRTRQQVVFEVTAAWFEAQRSRKRQEAAQASVRQLEAHLATVTEYFRLGKVPELDVLQARVSLAAARQMLVGAENATQVADLQLRNAMGLPPDAPLEVPAPPDPLLPDQGSLDMDPEMVGRALSQRPEALEAETRIARAEADLRQTKAGLLPEVRAVGEYYREGTSWPLNLDQWFLGVHVGVPIFDGGATRHAKAAGEANTEAAEADRDTVRQLVELEVRQAQLRVRESAERVAVAEAAVTEAQRALEIEKRRYELGMSSVLDVLDTETAMTQAAYNYIDAVFASHTARASLVLALGEDPPAEVTAVEEDN